METSIFIAKILGLAYTVIGIGMIADKDYYYKMMNKMRTNTPVLYLGGIMALVIGFLIVMYHNVWIESWIVIITILGWAALIKGVLLLLIPEAFMDLTTSWFKNKNSFLPIGVCALILGLVLGYFGFVA